MNRPPEKLSSLIRLALDDLAKCEADEKYVINMRAYHVAVEGECNVCLAGAVMAQTLGVPPSKTSCPRLHPSPWPGALRALDYARMGMVRVALVWYNGTVPDRIRNCEVTEYTRDPARFRLEVLEVAECLEGFDL